MHYVYNRNNPVAVFKPHSCQRKWPNLLHPAHKKTKKINFQNSIQCNWYTVTQVSLGDTFLLDVRGSHSSAAENSSLLGCDTALNDN